MTDNTAIIPARLHQGDCIGLFSPSGPVRDRERVDAGIRILHDLGFKTRYYQLPAADLDYLAAADSARGEEFHAMWQDDEVKALMAVRGGYGCLRIINNIHFDLLRSRPKVMIGFSDLTVLLNSVSHRTGLMTIHGPVVSSLVDCDRESIHALTAFLAGGLPPYLSRPEFTVLRAGKAEGILRGGNLTSLVHLVGTPWELAWDNALLLLEDTGEPMYKIDRMLTQLHQAGRFKNLAGLILGTFDLGEDPVLNLRLQEQVWRRFLELTEQYGYPVWGAFPAGHREANYPVPLGITATMDSSAAALRPHHLLI